MNLIIDLVVVVFWWVSHTQSRESALRWAKWGCEKRRCQLLDQAVVWRRICLRKRADQWCLEWVFSFEYALDSNRYTGKIVVFGRRLQEIFFPSDAANLGSKVINLNDYR